MSRPILFIRRLGVLVPMLALACDSVAITPLGVDRLEITPASIELVVGGTIQLRASALAASGGTISLGATSWSTSDPTVAQVDNDGMLTGLSVGVAAVTVSANGVAASAPVNVRAAGSLSLSDSSVTFDADQGGADPAPVVLRIGDSGAASQGLSAQVVHAAGQPFGWLLATLSSTNGPADLRIEARVAGLPAGEYDAEVRVTSRSTAEVSVVRVELRVSDPNPAIQVDQDTVRFSGADQTTLQVTNGGGGSLTGLTTRVRYVGGGSTWLQVALASSVAPTTLDLTSVPTGLPPGTYQGFVDVLSATPGVTTATIPVVLEVGSAVPVLQLTPARVDLIHQTGGTAPTASVQIDNQGGGTISGLTKAVSYAPNEPVGWLNTTLSGTTSPASLSLEAVPGSLPVGTYTASVEIAGSGVAPKILPVTLTVTAAAPTAPAAPSGAAAIAASPTTVDLTWADNSTNETVFEIERATAGGAFAAIGSAGVNATSFADGGLTEGTRYEYRVRACNGVGCSAYSNTASVVTPITQPAAPSGLTGTPSATGVALSWTDNSGNETGFEIERADAGGGFVALASVGANMTTYTDATTTTATTYEYRVRACNTAGCSAYSNVVSVTTPVTVPNTPTGLTAAVSGSSVDMSWTDNSTNETSFSVERAAAGGAFAEIGTTATDVSRFSDATAAAGTTYEYRVRACNAAGCSAYSNVATVTTPASLPPAPSGLVASASGSAAVDLTWTDNSSNETGFEIERATGGGAFASIGSAPADATDFTDSTVTAGVAYSYRVTACNATGCSAFSNIASVTVPASAPPRPASLTASVLSANDIDLDWPDVAGETTYEIQQRIGSGSWQDIATVGANTISFRVAGLSPGTQYRFRIRACNAGGCSGRRNSGTVSTQNPTTVPADPTGMAFVSTSAAQVVVRWTDTSNDETYFVIEEGDLFGPWLGIGQVGVNVTTFTDTAVRRGFAIYYRVRACNPVGCSSPSAPINITIP